MFYNSITLRIGRIPVIVYPCKGIEALFNKKGSVEKHLRELYEKNSLNAGEYNIIILWNEGKDIMADVWVFDKTASWGSGPLVDVRIFRNSMPDNKSGVSAGDGLVLLGLEEQQRWKSKSLDEYINGKRPKLPKKIAIGKSIIC
jgi:hypothetical protein